MSVSLVSCTEDIEARTVTYNDDGTRVGTRRWTVVLDLSAATNEERAGAEAFAEAALPVPLYSRHPAYPAMVARTATTATLRTDTHAVTVGYSSKPFAARSDGTGGTGGVSGGSGIGGGGETPNAGGDNSQKATLRPPEVYYFTKEKERVVETDAESSAAVRNAAGDRFDPPVMADTSELYVRLTYWRPKAWFSLDRFSHINCRNSSAVVLAGITFPTKSLLVKKIDPQPVWDQEELPGVGPPAVTSLTLVYKITVELKIDSAGLHNESVLNAGKRRIVTVGGSTKLQAITGPDGGIVSEPVPLNAGGTDVVASGSPPNYISVKKYPATNIASLWS